MFASWIKSIVMFAVFSSLVFFLLPDETYRKYMQTAAGCIMTILVIAPLMQAGRIDDVLSYQYYKEQWTASVSEDDRRYYADVMEQMVETYIEETWRVRAQAAVTCGSSYEMERVGISVQEGTEPEQLEEIRQAVISGYGVSEDAVSVAADLSEDDDDGASP